MPRLPSALRPSGLTVFGKYFDSTFTGSMYGAGPDVFAVWGYVIAHARDGTVELNPRALAPVIGTTVARIQAAVAFLCRPDPHSRNPADDGRRLVREGEYQYRVVSHAVYRALRTADDRREYMRRKQRESRARKKASMDVSKRSDGHTTVGGRPVSNGLSTASTYPEAEPDPDHGASPPSPTEAPVDEWRHAPRCDCAECVSNREWARAANLRSGSVAAPTIRASAKASGAVRRTRAHASAAATSVGARGEAPFPGTTANGTKPAPSRANGRGPAVLPLYREGAAPAATAGDPPTAAAPASRTHTRSHSNRARS